MKIYLRDCMMGQLVYAMIFQTPTMTKHFEDKVREIELSSIEKAIIILARHIDRLPYCEYRVMDEVLEELGIEFVPSTPKEHKHE